MTSARIVRLFTISSRSPMRFPKPVGKTNWPDVPVVAALSLGTKASDDFCFGPSSWTAEVCFFPQPATISHTDDSKTTTVRNGARPLWVSGSSRNGEKLLGYLDR